MKKIYFILFLSISSISFAQTENKNFLLDNFILAGAGGGISYIKTPVKECNKSLDIDLIVLNTFVSVKLSNIGDDNKFNVSSATEFQFGLILPLLKLGPKGDKMNKCLAIVPIYEYGIFDLTHVEGHYYHTLKERVESNWTHICWHDDSEIYRTYQHAFGGGVLYKGGNGFIMAKFTSKSIGISVGVCI